MKTNTLFVKKTTKSVYVVNALSAGAVKLESKLQFANATFTCKRGGRHRTTGTGIRLNQRYVKLYPEIINIFLQAHCFGSGSDATDWLSVLSDQIVAP